MSNTIAAAFSEKARKFLIDSETGKPICYYKILGIEPDCVDAATMKRCYYKAALKWHPDKQRHSDDLEAAEVAEEVFKYLQDAWAVLNDPNDRAYYDAHRDEVLLGGRTIEPDEFYGSETNVNLSAFRNSRCYRSFNDEPGGFYKVYEEVFRELAREEQRAACARIANSTCTKDVEAVIRSRSVFYRDGHISLGSLSKDAMTAMISKFKDQGSSLDDEIARIIPAFGTSESSEASVTRFYSYWKRFSTIKEFSHCDMYTTNESNPKIKKLAERENERLRREGRAKFSEKIRQLITFVENRDPRLQKFGEEAIRRREEEKQRKEEEMRIQEAMRQEAREKVKRETADRYTELMQKLRNGNITQIEMLELEKLNIRSGPSLADKLASDALAKKKNQDKKGKQSMEEQQRKEVLTLKDLNKELVKLGLDFDAKKPEEREINKLICKICKKKCISEGDFKGHLTSKKHKQAMSSAPSESAKANNESEDSAESNNNKMNYVNSKRSGVTGYDDDEDLLDEDLLKAQSQALDFAKSKKRRNNRFKDSDSEEEEKSEPNIEQIPQKQKPQQQKAKKNENITEKAAQKSSQDGDTGTYKCKKCNKRFDSNNALHKHLKESGHAALKQ